MHIPSPNLTRVWAPLTNTPALPKTFLAPANAPRCSNTIQSPSARSMALRLLCLIHSCNASAYQRAGCALVSHSAQYRGVDQQCTCRGSGGAEGPGSLLPWTGWHKHWCLEVVGINVDGVANTCLKGKSSRQSKFTDECGCRGGALHLQPQVGGGSGCGIDCRQK